MLRQVFRMALGSYVTENLTAVHTIELPLVHVFLFLFVPYIQFLIALMYPKAEQPERIPQNIASVLVKFPYQQQLG